MPARTTSTKPKTVAKAAAKTPAAKPTTAATPAKAASKSKEATIAKAMPAPVAVPAAKRKPVVAKMVISPEERYRMVAEAAYFIAEKRGFVAGDHNADWAKAEAEIAAKLARG